MQRKHNRNPREPGSRLIESGRTGERGYATDPFLAIVAALVLLAAAAFVAIGMPQALELATNHAHASIATLTNDETADDEDQPLQAADYPEPFIVDDLRTEGVMYAYADIFCPIEC